MSVPPDHSALATVPDGVGASRSTFVGRARELSALHEALRHARAGQGRVVMLVGEAGIGKTRTAMEFAAQGRAAGALVLRGGCYEGEWAPPFGPVAEAIAAHVRQCDADTLRDSLGLGAAPIARVVPAVRERLPDVPEPAPLQPDEERFRLFDAVSQFLIATARRQPVILILDDLHWADKGTVSMLRHVARFAPQHRWLILGAYREVELEPQHALTDALGSLYRETACERVLLRALDAAEVAQLVADSEVPHDLREKVAGAIYAITAGNPFFVQEVLRQWIDEGAGLVQGAAVPIGIPDSVRQVLRQRVLCLPADTRQLLTVGAAFGGPFHLVVAARVAGIDEGAALNAIDRALRTQLVRPTDNRERYDFTHALVRATLYSELNPSRQVRLHRQLAEEMEHLYGGGLAVQSAEIAQQYYRSRDLPGGHRGVRYAMDAAACAEAASAGEDAATFLRIALALLPHDDTQRARLHGRLGLALAWAFSFDEALTVAIQASQLIAAAESAAAAAKYLADLLTPMWEGGFFRGAFALAQRGLGYAGDSRDAPYASLMAMDVIRREAEGCETRLDTAERRDVARIFQRECASRGNLDSAVPIHARPFLFSPSRQDRGARGWPWDLGEWRRGAALDGKHALDCEERGRLAAAAYHWSNVFRFHVALGNFVLAADARERSVQLAARLPASPVSMGHLAAGDDEWRMALDEGWDAPMAGAMPDAESMAMVAWFRPALLSALARTEARKGNQKAAIDYLTPMLSALDDPPAWALGAGYVKIVCDAAETLWLTGHIDHLEPIAANVRHRVIAVDVHHPMMDGRLALARLCALQGRHDEANEWFSQARVILDKQGARPLRAIVDYDEALMYARRGGAGDPERARPLLETAAAQFRAIGMPGWIRRAEYLLATGREWSLAAQQEAPSMPEPVLPRVLFGMRREQSMPWEFRREGDYWTLACDGKVLRLKHGKGLEYLSVLLRHPGEEFLALDLVARCRSNGEAPKIVQQGDLIALDASSKAAYKQRLAELRETLEEAESLNDRGAIERTRVEIEFIEDELTAAIGLGGRDRKTGANAERARSTVTKGIKGAIAKIGAANPSLGRHLGRTVRTGIFCAYEPADDEGPRWDL